MIRPGDSELRGALWVGQVLGREPVEQGAVELFGQVVAPLVGPVDAALDIGELSVGGAGRAGFIFNVPEIEVGAMLASDTVEPIVSWGQAIFGCRHGLASVRR